MRKQRLLCIGKVFPILWVTIALIFHTCQKEGECNHRETGLKDVSEQNDPAFSLTGCIANTTKELQLIFSPVQIPDFSPCDTILDTIAEHLTNLKKQGLSWNRVIDTFINILYSELGIIFDPDQDDIENIMPQSILRSRRGSCVGVSLIFLLVAEKISCPLSGVFLPGHFLVRLNSGQAARNIEPNKYGYSHPDSYYAVNYFNQKSSWYGLRNFSSMETAAVLYYTVANICRIHKKIPEATRFYSLATSLLDNFPEAWGNLGLVSFWSGDKTKAADAFKKAFLLKPDLMHLAQNKGAFEMHEKDYSTAIETFRRGLRYEPDNPELLYGLASAFYSSKNPDSSYSYLSKLIQRGFLTEREQTLKQRLEKTTNNEKN